MAEYIKKDSIVKFLRRMAGIAIKSHAAGNYTYYVATFLDRIVDVIEKRAKPIVIIHCKECDYYDKGENFSESWEWCTCHKHNVYDNYFCASGVLKENNNDNEISKGTFEIV